jgi:phospholipid/cholesterol/gamma-HCH transport system substrate-binding protein
MNRQTLALAAAILVLVSSGLYLVLQPKGRVVTAYFTSASALFPDNEVRVLGVPVGTITSITPEGTQVRVEMRIDDADLQLPADVRAAVVSPSLVTGRYVQLAPTYSGGAELQDGAVIPLERTLVPLSVDDLTRTATELSRALGPDGANADGAVSDALDVGAANLDGNGQALNDTIRNLGDLSGTLAGSSDDLFGTVTELQKFTETIADDDAKVREFNGRVADVTGFLADERGQLGGALTDLAKALADVDTFVRDNRDSIHTNVDQLADVTQALVNQQRALAEILDIAPAALGNLANTYNGSSGTLDTRANLNELTMPPIAMICELVDRGTPAQLPDTVADACLDLQPVLDGAVPLPTAAEVLTSLQAGEVPPVPGLALPVEGP